MSLPDPIDTEVVDGVSVALGDAHFLSSRSAADDQLFIFIWLKQVGHLARIQNVVDILKEFLNYNL